MLNCSNKLWYCMKATMPFENVCRQFNIHTHMCRTLSVSFLFGMIGAVWCDIWCECESQIWNVWHLWSTIISTCWSVPTSQDFLVTLETAWRYERCILTGLLPFPDIITWSHDHRYHQRHCHCHGHLHEKSCLHPPVSCLPPLLPDWGSSLPAPALLFFAFIFWRMPDFAQMLPNI